jgi:hypothetical protein
MLSNIKAIFFLPRVLSRQFFYSFFPKGITDDLPPVGHIVEPDEPFLTTGMSLNRINKWVGVPRFFLMYGKKDWVVTSRQTLDLLNEFTGTKSRKLSRYRTLSHVAELNKGHFAFFMKNESEASEKLLAFIDLIYSPRSKTLSKSHEEFADYFNTLPDHSDKSEEDQIESEETVGYFDNISYNSHKRENRMESDESSYNSNTMKDDLDESEMELIESRLIF